MTRIKESILEQLEKHQLYRRLIVLFMVCLITYTTIESFAYANVALGQSGIETAAIIAAIQVPVTALMGFVSKLYWDKK